MTKKKFELEIAIHASPSFIYNYISNPSGLSEWFADNVNSRGEKFTFMWNGTEEVAHLIKSKYDEYVRFRWDEDEGTKYFFEIRIVVDELTNDVSVMITDFAEENEVEESKELWVNQFDELKHVIGA